MWVSLGRPIPKVLLNTRQYLLHLAVIFTAFLWIFALPDTASAQSAGWEEGAVVYQDRTFSGPRTAEANSPMGLAEGTQYYEHREGDRVSVVYFPPDTDVDNARGARYAEFTDNGSNDFPSRGQSQTISVDPRSGTASTADGEGEEGEEDEATSCAVNGIGYILCPIMGFIADAMDKIYDFLQNFLEVRPLSTDSDSSLHSAWKYMQSFANIAFVIVFLVIVYSQVTGQGLNNYNIKRMIPRMVIAAMLVNVSYYLCAILVDLSNIAGASLQDLLTQIRTELIQGQEQNRLDSVGWGEMTTYILSGGTIAAAGVIGLSGAGAGVIYLLVPILITAIFAVFVAVAILAARQALITILIIIAPLAFVAFVLPGTQKYFNRWKDIFQTMLLLYPIFSVLFGGSQLAGYLIAQNADRNEVVLLAMFVTVAPLIITPFLIKFSGGLLGKLAGMINNPTKGIGDRTKNWAQGKKDLERARRMADHSVGSGLARKLADSKDRDEALKKRYETRRKRRFDASNIGTNMAIEQMREDDKARKIAAENDMSYESMKTSDNVVRVEAASVKLAEAQRDNAKKNTEVFLDELKTKVGGDRYGANDAAVSAISQRMQHESHQHNILGSKAAMAAMTERSEYSSAMMARKSMQAQAAGIAGEQGEMIAAANAVVEMRQDFGKGVSAVAELMQQVRLSGSDVYKLAMKQGDVTAVDETGQSFTFKSGDEHVLEAAVEKLLKEKGNMQQKLDLVAKSSDPDYAGVRTTISDGVAKNVASGVPFLGGRPLDAIATQGVSSADFGGFVREYVKKGKVNQSALAGADELALKEMVDALVTNGSSRAGLDPKDFKVFESYREQLFEAATDVLSNPRLQEAIKGNARGYIETLSAASVNSQLNKRGRP